MGIKTNQKENKPIESQKRIQKGLTKAAVHHKIGYLPKIDQVNNLISLGAKKPIMDS